MGSTRPPFRDVGYARLSHHDPDEQGAIARQKQDIRRVSERTGGQLLDPILVDNAVSASKYAHRKRKDYPKLLDMARAGLIDRAVIYDVDRLLRIPKELEALIDLVEELGDRFTIIAVNGSMDLTTSQGIYHARISVADAAKASDDTSRRLRSKFDQLAQAGLPLHASGANRAFGYLDGGMEIDLSEASLIQEAAADVLRGEGLNAIARRWNQAGVRNRRGGPWSNRTVRSVLTSPRNAGRRIHRGEDHGPAAWPPIIDPDTHARLCRLVAERTRDPGRRTPFTGLFVTTDGRSMRREVIGRHQRRVYRTWRPHPGVDVPRSITIGPAETLEELVLEVLFADVESGAVARRIAERRSRPRLLGEDPAMVELEMIQLAEDKAERRIGRAEWLVMRRPLERRLTAAQAAAGRVDDLAALDGLSPGIRGEWEGYSDDRRRRVLFAMFERVEIAPAPRLGPGFDPGRVTPVGRA
jgi:site-specific DNA recombinase